MVQEIYLVLGRVIINIKHTNFLNLSFIKGQQEVYMTQKSSCRELSQTQGWGKAAKQKFTLVLK